MIATYPDNGLRSTDECICEVKKYQNADKPYSKHILGTVTDTKKI